MSGDPRIAPSAARERRAWLAGLRPRTRWLVASGLALALWVALSGTDRATVARTAGLGVGQAGPELAGSAALQHLVTGTLGIAAVVLGMTIVITIGSGGLGGVSSAERRRLVLAPIGLRGATAILGALGLLLATLALLRGTIAGAARAFAASEAGLAALWTGTASRVLVVMAGLLAVAGVVELLASRAANRRALFQTEVQARAEAKSVGSRRG